MFSSGVRSCMAAEAPLSRRTHTGYDDQRAGFRPGQGSALRAWRASSARDRTDVSLADPRSAAQPAPSRVRLPSCPPIRSGRLSGSCAASERADAAPTGRTQCKSRRRSGSSSVTAAELPGCASDRSDRHRSPDDEPHVAFIRPCMCTGRDGLPEADLVDVVDDTAAAPNPSTPPRITPATRASLVKNARMTCPVRLWPKTG